MLRAFSILASLTLLLAPSSLAALVSAAPAPLPSATSENASTASFEGGSESRIGLLRHNDPVNHTDPSGLAIDTIADIGFIGYDLYKLATEGGGRGGENWKALGLDSGAALVPFATGAGAGQKGSCLSSCCNG